MSLKGFGSLGEKSKVASHKVISDSAAAHKGTVLGMFGGSNPHIVGVGLASGTKAAVNPTSDADDNPRAVGGQAPQDNGDSPMVPSSRGGASGDGPTPGFTGSGTGIAELNGAQGN